MTKKKNAIKRNWGDYIKPRTEGLSRKTRILGGDEQNQNNHLTPAQYRDIMRRVANENYKKWNMNSPQEAYNYAINDPTYDYWGYYNKYPNSAANANTHWTDEFKTAQHPTFSTGSKYSGKKSKYNPYGKKGGTWINNGGGGTYLPREDYNFYFDIADLVPYIDLTKYIKKKK